MSQEISISGESVIFLGTFPILYLCSWHFLHQRQLSTTGECTNQGISKHIWGTYSLSCWPMWIYYSCKVLDLYAPQMYLTHHFPCWTWIAVKIKYSVVIVCQLLVIKMKLLMQHTHHNFSTHALTKMLLNTFTGSAVVWNFALPSV